MFKRVLVANRGEIAVRVVRACRDMGIWAIALYDKTDRSSLHVRLADECFELRTNLGYLDGAGIVEIARECGADAIHPGYGFLSEQPEFVRACEDAGIAFIGPPSSVMTRLSDQIAMLETARLAGFNVPQHSSQSFTKPEFNQLEAEAHRLGFPLIIKPCGGGRGRAARLVREPGELRRSVRRAHAEALIMYGDSSLYLEQAIVPAKLMDVQLVADHHGNLVHLGEREASIQRNNQKLMAETPAPGLTPGQREQVLNAAVELGHLFGFRNVGTVEFALDPAGTLYFTEIKGRIQVEHPVTEMVSQVDLVREQIEIAAGKRLTLKQDDIQLRGWAMQCRINAEDPWNHFLPSPGYLHRFRLPGGTFVRVDTYGYSGGMVPVRFDPILAKLVVWGEDRPECVRRLRRALQDFAVGGVRTNLPLYQRILEDSPFIEGHYDTSYLREDFLTHPGDQDNILLRDLAVAAALAYLIRYQSSRPVIPERFLDGWHRATRRLPG